MAREFFDIDTSHSTLSFAVRHMMVSHVRGHFTNWSGVIQFDQEAPERSSVWIRIDAESLDTGDARRDAHLRSADFFDVGEFPTIAFESAHVLKLDGDSYRITGNLTIRGIRHEASFDVEMAGEARDPMGAVRTGFHGKLSLNRRDFGLLWNQVLETGGVLVGNRVEIEVEVEAVRRAEPQQKVA